VKKVIISLVLLLFVSNETCALNVASTNNRIPGDCPSSWADMIHLIAYIGDTEETLESNGIITTLRGSAPYVPSALELGSPQILSTESTVSPYHPLSSPYQ